MFCLCETSLEFVSPSELRLLPNEIGIHVNSQTVEFRRGILDASVATLALTPTRIDPATSPLASEGGGGVQLPCRPALYNVLCSTKLEFFAALVCSSSSVN